MLLYVFATFYIISVTGYSILQSNELQWADTYSVKATRISLTANIVEDYTAWKTNKSSRVDYNHGAVKVITLMRSYWRSRKYEIHPETTEEELNKIVCHSLRRSSSDEDTNDILFLRNLDEILPFLSDYELYEAVGNETIEETDTVRFEYTGLSREKEIRATIWAFKLGDQIWSPVRYEVKKFNVLLGSLVEHEIWSYFDFVTDIEEEVFDIAQFGCEDTAVQHAADSEKITKELLFVDPGNDDHFNHVFNHFQNKFYRKYAHEYELALRKTIFMKNLRMISSVNRRNLTYKLGINQFSDWTSEEIERSHGAIPRREGQVGTVPFPYEESQLNDIVSKLPKQFDMRLLGLISPVKNQESCGACWTFAASAVTESALAKINGGKLLALSNQAMVDCAYEGLIEMHAGGCHGGTDTAAYDFIMKHGLPTEQEYGPYKNRDGFCDIGNMTKTYQITGYTDVTPNNYNAMKVAVVNHGPLFIYVHASQEFQAYSSGIFYQNNEECRTDRPSHAVALVGYGERYGDLFWILKNSFGESWGVDGYMLVAAKDNVCGVASKPSYPVF